MRLTRLAVAVAAITALAGEARANRALARALVEEGAALRSAGNKEEALEHFEQAIESDPDYLPAYDAAAWLWFGAGQFSEAITHLERATLKHPDYAFGWYALAYAYRKTERYDLAVLAYESYISLRPREADPYFGLAMAQKRAGRREEASRSLQRYLTLESRPERAEFVERAREELEALGVEPPPSPVTAAGEQLSRARRLLRDRRYASTLAFLSRLAPERDEQRAELWRLRARAHLGAGRPEAAVSAGLVALASDPGDRGAYRVLIEASGLDAVARYFESLAPLE